MELYYDYLQTMRGGRGVRFPSDNLRGKALLDRSGPCRVYRLGKPMTAVQFRAMPRDLRRTYLQRLRSRGGSEESVGRMLGLPREATRALLLEYRVQLDQPDAAAWSRFLAL